MAERHSRHEDETSTVVAEAVPTFQSAERYAVYQEKKAALETLQQRQQKASSRLAELHAKEFEDGLSDAEYVERLANERRVTDLEPLLERAAKEVRAAQETLDLEAWQATDEENVALVNQRYDELYAELLVLREKFGALLTAHVRAEQYNLLLPAVLRDKRNMPTGNAVLQNFASIMPTAMGWHDILSGPLGMVPVASLEAIKGQDTATQPFNPLVVNRYLSSLDDILKSA